MQIRNSPGRYGLLTKALHWVLTILILFLVWLGWYLVGLSYYDRWYPTSLEWHKSLGMIVLLLAVLKIGWQLYTPGQTATANLKPWERKAAKGMHRLLALMMLLIPATGYLISTSDGKAVEVFNWFAIPALIPVNETLRDWAIELHFYLSYGVVVLAAGHAGAALKHHFINKDDTLGRMLWK